MGSETEYDVALSFAGENRNYVEKVAKCFSENNISVFYDEYEDLWGKDLYQHLDEVYRKKSKYTIIFISEFYAKKAWTNHELKSAQARAFSENREYILPVRMDDTNLPGIRETVGYLDARKITPEVICEKIKNKLNKSSIPEFKSDEYKEEIPVINIKRTIGDKEKSDFLNKSFLYLKEYFQKALVNLTEINPHIKAHYEEINSNKFLISIDVEDKIKASCKIFILSDTFTWGAIYYMDSTGEIDSNTDNTYNAFAYIEDNGLEIFFNINSFDFALYGKDEREEYSVKEVSKFFWSKFLKNLNY